MKSLKTLDLGFLPDYKVTLSEKISEPCDSSIFDLGVVASNPGLVLEKLGTKN